MEISILLAEQILAMFLTMAVGFGVVVVHSFQIELTDDKIKGLMIAIGLSVVLEI